MESAAEWVDVDSLVPWDRNPRRNDAAVQKVAESIDRFGFAAPLVARLSDRVVIAGHTRLKAAKRLGMARVPVRFVDLTETQARLLALADNRVGEEASWDYEELPKLLAELDGLGVDLALTGFDQEEIDRFLVRAADEDGPVDFVSFEASSVETTHECPKCHYRWR
jgi:ParB-like chromosome segregation protein Spo0J